jgi:hypothetical protein
MKKINPIKSHARHQPITALVCRAQKATEIFAPNTSNIIYVAHNLKEST